MLHFLFLSLHSFIFGVELPHSNLSLKPPREKKRKNLCIIFLLVIDWRLLGLFRHGPLNRRRLIFSTFFVFFFLFFPSSLHYNNHRRAQKEMPFTFPFFYSYYRQELTRFWFPLME
jgi:hypothetical protein